jgi:hypothetical protein
MPIARRYSTVPWFLQTAAGDVINNTYTVNDPELHSKVLKFPYTPNWGFPDVVTIFAESRDGDVRYEDVPFCRLPPPSRIFASVCTQNYVTNKQRILDWVAWHRVQGFQHAYVYINEEHGARKMRTLLEKAINNGSVSIIDWAWPRAYDFHDQPVTQTSCIYRARGRSKWIGINDLDEIFLANGEQTVADVLNKYEPKANEIGSIACCNRWISGPGRLSEINKCAVNCDDPPHRQKNLVRPENIDYFCNHRIMQGMPEQRSDGLELVNGHYSDIRGEAQMTDCDLVSRYKDAVENWSSELS